MHSVKIVYWLLLVILFSYSNSVLGSCGTIGLQMMTATKSGNYNVLKEVLEKEKEQGCKLPDTYGGYDSYIMVAARNQNYKIISLLLEYGLDIDAQEKPTGSARIYKTALMEAVENKNTELIKFLLENGADPQYKSSDGVSAMDIAATSSDIDIIKLFIKYGTNKNDLLFMVLRQGSEKNRLELVKMLLISGADPNGIDTINVYQPTPLMKAVGNIAMEKEIQFEIVKLLIENGADVNVRNGQGRTAFFFVAYYADSNYDVATLLLDSGAEVFYLDSFRNTHFMAPLRSGNFGIFLLLIWKGFLAITLVIFIYSFLVARRESSKNKFAISIKLFTKMFIMFLSMAIIIIVFIFLLQGPLV